MEKGFRRPKSEDDLKERETAGLWRAQVLAKKIGESHQKITLNVILLIHGVFFEYANPDIAGRFRKTGEDIKKLKCIEPPLGNIVMEKMYGFWRELDIRVSHFPQKPRIVKGKKSSKKTLQEWNDQVVGLAAWTQYKITSIHPFCEGNGRMARLMTNLILYRFGLQPTDIKYEGENKKLYLDALCQIDNEDDFRPLRQLITKGIITSYRKLREAQWHATRK